MNACLSDFRVVNPTLRTFSAAEARIAQSSIRFNNLSAAELGYPENVRLLISSEGTTLAILTLFASLQSGCIDTSALRRRKVAYRSAFPHKKYLREIPHADTQHQKALEHGGKFGYAN